MRTLSRIARVTLVIVSMGLGTVSLADQESRQSPHSLIRQAANDVYGVGETSGSFDEAQRAIERAAVAIEQSVAGGDTQALTQRNDSGKTPLIAAAARGFAPIVESLLKSDIVREGIDTRDSSGLSAWDHANLATRRSLWACRDVLSQSPWSWIPLISTTFWYASGNPYLSTRELLEEAEASKDIEPARNYWLAHCHEQTRETRDAVSITDDLLVTLVTRGEASLKAAIASMESDSKR